jgi:uncharacterized protein YcbK (DUF882 family)
MVTQLTPHFTLEELNPQGAPLTVALRASLAVLAHELEGVRHKLGGRPIKVTSGYRTARYNRGIGGTPGSRHVLAEAADIQVQGLTPKEVQAELADWPGGMGYGESFTHLDIRHLSRARPTTHRRVRWHY